VGAILASVYFTFGENALLVMAIAVIALGLGLLLVFRYLPRTRPARALVLESAIEAHATGEEVEVGMVGTALTDLRPGGVARFGARRVDVVANRGFIPKGTSIRVVEVRGPTVVVEALEE
jgi:membrane-bound serine protease (ClpP class)